MTPFMDLPAEVRNEVERLAKVGKRYPDASVAESARLWASEYRATHSWVGAIGMLVADLGSAAVTGSTGSPSQRYPLWVLSGRLIALDR